MSSIAIFPCSHTPAAAIISDLAKNLELTVYTDENLFAEASKASGLPVEKLQAMMYGKTSVFNQFTLEKEKVVNHFRSVLAERLDSPQQYLFHGFLVSLISPRISHVLKVLVVDGRQERIARAIESGLSDREAKKAVKTDDLAAYNWSDFLFKKEAYDSSLFDLVVPVEGKSAEGVKDFIIKCFHTTSVLQTPESMAAVRDMGIEAAVEKLLQQEK